MDSLYIAMLLILVIAFGSLEAIRFYRYLNTTKAVLSNKEECYRLKRKQLIDNWTKYFWSNKWRFIWISIGFIFFALLGIAIGGFGGILFSVFVILLYIPFAWWARKSYILFPKYAKEKLDSFENAIREGIKKEITFEGDNIQKFSSADDEFDTEPKIFEFPVNVEKFDYPIFEKNPLKKTVIKRRKLEFLILSREYFSICKGATTFDLLEPARAPIPKRCVEIRAAGECNEYYYSQMQNVEYDGTAIVIKYYGDIPDVKFPCKKGTHKPAMKALKEKLRIIERQRLRKIEEHRHYEDIKEKRLQREQQNMKAEDKK